MIACPESAIIACVKLLVIIAFRDSTGCTGTGNRYTFAIVHNKDHPGITRIYYRYNYFTSYAIASCAQSTTSDVKASRARV